MPKETEMHKPESGNIEKRSLSRFADAVKQLAHVGSRPYMSDESFVPETEMLDSPNEQIGVCAETQTAEYGQLKIIWFNERAKEVLTRADPRYEDLQAHIQFGKENGGSYVYGAVGLYTYGNGEGDINLSMRGYLASYDRDVENDLFRVCHRLGLDPFFSDMPTTAGQGIEQAYEGDINSKHAWLMAHALEDLALQNGARP